LQSSNVPPENGAKRSWTPKTAQRKMESKKILQLAKKNRRVASLGK